MRLTDIENAEREIWMGSGLRILVKEGRAERADCGFLKGPFARSLAGGVRGGRRRRFRGEGVVYSRHFMQRHGYEGLRTQAKEIFVRNSLIHCPYFGTTVVLNAEGLHHLRSSAERERSKPE